MDLHILSNEKRPFNPVSTCLCTMLVTGKEHSGHTAAFQSPFCPKCPSAHCKSWAGMRQQRSDPSRRAVDSPHGWLEVTEPKERQIQKGFMNSSLQRVRVYIVHSLSKPFPLLHRKWLGKTEISVYTETFVFGTIPCERHFSCVNLIFFLLWRHEWDIFTTISSLWPTGPAPRPIFLLNQTLLCSGTRTTLSAVGKKTTLPQRSPGQTSIAIFKRQLHVYWEKQTNLRKGFFSAMSMLCVLQCLLILSLTPFRLITPFLWRTEILSFLVISMVINIYVSEAGLNDKYLKDKYVLFGYSAARKHVQLFKCQLSGCWLYGEGFCQASSQAEPGRRHVSWLMVLGREGEYRNELGGSMRR